MNKFIEKYRAEIRIFIIVVMIIVLSRIINYLTN